jgi:hypothetical protein
VWFSDGFTLVALMLVMRFYVMGNGFFIQVRNFTSDCLRESHRTHKLAVVDWENQGISTSDYGEIIMFEHILWFMIFSLYYVDYVFGHSRLWFSHVFSIEADFGAIKTRSLGHPWTPFRRRMASSSFWRSARLGSIWCASMAKFCGKDLQKVYWKDLGSMEKYKAFKRQKLDLESKWTILRGKSHEIQFQKYDLLDMLSGLFFDR